MVTVTPHTNINSASESDTHPTSDIDSQSLFLQKRRFIIKLGKALHKYGTPAYRLETHLQEVSKFLQVQSNFMVTPTSLTFVMSESDDEQQDYSHIVRVKPGELDLGALARIDELVDELASEQRTLSEALERLDAIPNKPHPYGSLLTFLSYGFASAGFAMLMQTNWNSIFASALIGFVVFLFQFWAEKSQRIAGVLEPLVALVSALLASAIAVYEPTVNVPLVILSSIIVYIPGLALTLGLSELAARNLMSGTARIMDAVMSLFKLYFGAVLGVSIATLLWPGTVFVDSTHTPAWTSWLAVTVLGLSLVVLFKMRIKDMPWGMLSGYLAYASTLWGSLFLGAALGGFIGAFAMGVYSNLFSRIRHLPSTIVSLLGLVMLVPGSKIYIGLNTAVSGQNILNTNDIGAQSFLILMSLVAGLIFADVVLPSQESL
ncbi:threonine/serine ThrE exporter family protein [Eionea flava]